MFYAVDVRALEIGDLEDKIAFLRNGEVWIATKDGRDARPITKTSRNIKDPFANFLFSPTLRYLAYTKFLRYADEPGLWEENEPVPQRAVSSIVITDLTTQKTVKEILPPEGDWIYPDRWLPDDRLLFHESSGFDISGFFEYDVRQNSQRELDAEKGSQLLGADVHPEGSLVAYVTDSGLGPQYRQHLHLLDLQSNADRILVSRRSILAPRISHQKKSVAFLEVEDVKGEYFHNLWIVNTKDGSVKHLYRRRGASALAWSLDDGFIGMCFSAEAILLAIQNPASTHKFQGTECVWIDTNKLLYVRGDFLYLYNVTTRQHQLFLKNASKPKFLHPVTGGPRLP